MYIVNECAFSYLLYPKKVDSPEGNKTFDNDVDRLYYYLNRGVPVDEGMPKPIYCTHEMVKQYGIDNLVMNMQRKYKYDYDIVVVKVPQELMRMEPVFGNSSIKDATGPRFRNKMLPILCRYEFNGEQTNMISSDYIESIYLRYPDCRRVINENWKIVSDESLGMNFSETQIDMIKLYGDDLLLMKNSLKLDIMHKENLNTSQMCKNYKNNEYIKSLVGYSQDIVDFLKKKYRKSIRIYHQGMSKSRIANVLMVEEKRKDKIERCAFIGE